MKVVYNATGFGIILGFVIGAIASGTIKMEAQTQLNAQLWAWWIVVITTILPLASYLQEKLILSGAIGGFVTGLGTGLGFFLLLAGKA